MRLPWATFSILLLSLHGFRTFAQEDFDVPPPPPIEDYEEGPIEESVPYEEGDPIEGPVYEVPPGSDEEVPISPQNLPRPGAPMLPRNSSGGGVGFNNSAFNRPSSSGISGGKLKFNVVEGEYWEKGKKRTRGKMKTVD